jgi:energy-coupling factor transport system permease protein
MAEVAFRYVNTHTVLHRIDPRSKLLLLVGFSVVGASRGWSGLLMLVPIMVGALFIVRVPLRYLAKELKGFLIFFGFILIISTIDLGIEPASIRARVSMDGFSIGLITVLRMVFVILTATLFTSITPIRQMRDAIYWLFKPVPHVNAVRLATMFGLSIRFIPLLFDEATMLKRAQASRGSAGSGRPLRQIRFVGFPLILRSFRRVETIVQAMVSRSYTEEHIRPELGFGPRDPVVVAAAAAICVGSMVLDLVAG